ncbi:MAG: hypothetical protein HC896_14960 [Bacteroidales bacterium]|nr:hypothetical protein [Bacteroidales bacterium]
MCKHTYPKGNQQQAKHIVGSGITLDSNKDAEWEETNLKANTLLSIIHNI